jgi:hypothetical protein
LRLFLSISGPPSIAEEFVLGGGYVLDQPGLFRRGQVRELSLHLDRVYINK